MLYTELREIVDKEGLDKYIQSELSRVQQPSKPIAQSQPSAQKPKETTKESSVSLKQPANVQKPQLKQQPPKRVITSAQRISENRDEHRQQAHPKPVDNLVAKVIDTPHKQKEIKDEFISNLNKALEQRDAEKAPKQLPPRHEPKKPSIYFQIPAKGPSQIKVNNEKHNHIQSAAHLNRESASKQKRPEDYPAIQAQKDHNQVVLVKQPKIKLESETKAKPEPEQAKPSIPKIRSSGFSSAPREVSVKQVPFAPIQEKRKSLFGEEVDVSQDTKPAKLPYEMNSKDYGRRASEPDMKAAVLSGKPIATPSKAQFSKAPNTPLKDVILPRKVEIAAKLPPKPIVKKEAKVDVIIRAKDSKLVSKQEHNEVLALPDDLSDDDIPSVANTTARSNLNRAFKIKDVDDNDVLQKYEQLLAKPQTPIQPNEQGTQGQQNDCSSSSSSQYDQMPSFAPKKYKNLEDGDLEENMEREKVHQSPPKHKGKQSPLPNNSPPQVTDDSLPEEGQIPQQVQEAQMQEQLEGFQSGLVPLDENHSQSEDPYIEQIRQLHSRQSRKDISSDDRDEQETEQASRNDREDQIYSEEFERANPYLIEDQPNSFEDEKIYLQQKLKENMKREDEINRQMQIKIEECKAFAPKHFDEILVFFRSKLNKQDEYTDQDQMQVQTFLKKRKLPDFAKFQNIYKIMHFEMELETTRTIIQVVCKKLNQLC